MINKKKPDRATKFQPKCILTDRQPAYTATGFLIPCCWVDNPWAMRDKNIQKFFDPKQHIDKHESVMDIMHGKVFTDFWDMLENEPDKAPDICKKYCGSKLTDKVTKKDHYVIPKEKHEEVYKKYKNLPEDGLITKDELK